MIPRFSFAAFANHITFTHFGKLNSVLAVTLYLCFVILEAEILECLRCSERVQLPCISLHFKQRLKFMQLYTVARRLFIFLNIVDINTISQVRLGVSLKLNLITSAKFSKRRKKS